MSLRLTISGKIECEICKKELARVMTGTTFKQFLDNPANHDLNGEVCFETFCPECFSKKESS